MFEIARLVIAFLGSAIAGIYDLKTSDIPDKLCIGMIIAGLTLHTAEGFLTGNFSGLISSLIAGLAFLAFGLLMYFTGSWGGGDGELLVAIGILLPSIFPIFGKPFLPSSLGLLMNVLLIGVVYSVFYVAIYSFSNRKKRKEVMGNIKNYETGLFLAGLAFFASSFFLSISILISILITLLLILPFLFKFFHASENLFYRKIPAKKLKEGDMIGEDIPRLKIFKRLIRGLTAEEIKKLKKLKSKKYILIRDGIRFGPVFPIALLVSVLFGDIFSIIFLCFV